jgi:hypothetical protein
MPVVVVIKLPHPVPVLLLALALLLCRRFSAASNKVRRLVRRVLGTKRIR